MDTVGRERYGEDLGLEKRFVATGRIWILEVFENP